MMAGLVAELPYVHLQNIQSIAPKLDPLTLESEGERFRPVLPSRPNLHKLDVWSGIRLVHNASIYHCYHPGWMSELT
jgi:hypothetical protein